MSLRDEVRSRQHAAMKAGETATVSTLRLFLAAVKNEEISVGHSLTDQEAQTVAARQVKQLRDARPDYEAGGRADLVAQTDAEIRLLSEYLPAQLSDSELESVVKRVVGEFGAKGPADMGRVMGAVMKEVKGKADGNRVRGVAGRLLVATSR